MIFVVLFSGMDLCSVFVPKIDLKIMNPKA